MYFQNNIIRYTLKNKMSIDEKLNKAHKYDVNIDKSEKWEFFQSISSLYLLNGNYCLPLSHMSNNMVMNEKEKKQFINFKLDIF